MADFIECRNCDSPYCDGCNMYLLATMLHRGKFDCLMNDKHSINCSADVVEVVHGEWVEKGIADVCSVCGRWLVIEQASADLNYCPNCGAKMDGDKNA